MEKSSFFNDEYYQAEDWARYLKTFFTNGIFNNGCMVKEMSEPNMQIFVESGSAHIEGYRYDNDDTKILNIENADGILNRIDNVVIRLNLNDEIKIQTMVVKGVFSAEPEAPELIRNSIIYDLKIAEIYIPANTTSITQDLITDTRFINSNCGNVTSPIQTPDTTAIFAQYDSKFHKWFETVKEELTNTPIGNLQANVNNILEILGLYVDTYSNEKTYALGDLTINNHKIHVCTTPIETPEEWNESKWEFVPFLIEENMEESEEEIE